MVALRKRDRIPVSYIVVTGLAPVMPALAPVMPALAPVTLVCIFHELRNIITVLLLSAAICLSRNIVETELAPVLFSPPSRLTRQPHFLTHQHLS